MSARRFNRYAWSVLAYNVLVILWGAYVRATGSGAGCGAHWPLCNGEVIPRAPRIATLIEFTHRLSSGLSLLLVVGLILWAWRSFPKGHQVRRVAALSMLFVITEALVGAALVLFAWVAQDASLGRVISISVHLVNTFLLLASLALTAWWSSNQAQDSSTMRLRAQGWLAWGLGVAFLGVLLLGMSGAITALGDTLFPSASLSEGLRQDFSSTANFLIRLRVWHPVLAVIVGSYTIILAILLWSFRAGRSNRRLAIGLGSIIVLQLCAGLVNLLLLAPVWMQLVHLLLADLTWITLVLTVASLGNPVRSGNDERSEAVASKLKEIASQGELSQ